MSHCLSALFLVSKDKVDNSHDSHILISERMTANNENNKEISECNKCHKDNIAGYCDKEDVYTEQELRLF